MTRRRAAAVWLLGTLMITGYKFGMNRAVPFVVLFAGGALLAGFAYHLVAVAWLLFAALCLSVRELISLVMRQARREREITQRPDDDSRAGS